MLDILDGIIATGAVVLALSLVVQAVQQIVKQCLDLKSKYMWSELLALFGDPDPRRLSAWVCADVEQRMRRPGDDRAAGGRGKRVISRAVAGGVGLLPEALLPGSLREKSVEPEAGRIVRELAQKIRSFGYEDLELLENVGRDSFKEIVKTLDCFRERHMKSRLKSVLHEIDVWFDVSMSAFQSHYIRRMKYWAFGISLVAVLVGNANLFEVYRDFASNKPVRDAAVAMGERLIALPPDSMVAGPSVQSGDSAVGGDRPGRIDVRLVRKDVEEIRGILESNTFQLWRWDSATLHRLFDNTSAGGWLMHCCGWLAMTLLVSLGAPFWYDFLKVVMGIKDKLKAGSDR